MKSPNQEIELLLCCARTHIEPHIEKHIKLLLQQDIDWTHLIQLSSHHRIMPLLWQSLKATCLEAVPEEIITKLRSYYQVNALRNDYLFQELINLLEKLKTEGIRAVSFKGPSLSIIAYGKLSLRQFADLDILVEKNNFLAAKKSLVEIGFQTTDDFKFANSTLEKLYFQEIDEVTLVKKENLVFCDLHQGITISHFRKNNIELSKLHNKLSNIILNKVEINTIHPDYLLILLCIHNTRHFWSQLNWICDINELIYSNKSINWSQVLKEATSIGCKYHLLLGLYLSNYYLQTEIPQDIQIAIKKSLRIKYLSRYVKTTIFTSSDRHPDQGFNINNFIYQLLLTNGWQGYKEILAYFIVPNSKDKQILNLPSWLSFLYYFLRPVRLCSQLLKKYFHW